MVFGNADNNIKYAQGVYRQLKDMGHIIEYVYSKRSKVISKLGHVVIPEEGYCQKFEGLVPMLGATEWSTFVDKWKRDHESEITKQLGYETGPQFQFLTGILFATSSSKNTVPLLQNVRLNMWYYCMSFVLILPNITFTVSTAGNPS